MFYFLTGKRGHLMLDFAENVTLKITELFFKIA